MYEDLALPDGQRGEPLRVRPGRGPGCGVGAAALGEEGGDEAFGGGRGEQRLAGRGDADGVEQFVGLGALAEEAGGATRRAETTYSSTSKVVSMTTRTAASSGSALIMRVAASPSVPGIRMSIRTTSGRVRRASSTACAPSEASPTTSMSGSESTSTLKALRRSAWSSASSTLTGAAEGWSVAV